MASGDALLVSAADKLHNARAILSDYRELGEGLWSRFNAPKEDQLWFYDAMVETLRQTSTPKTLVDELSRVVGETETVGEVTSLSNMLRWQRDWELSRQPCLEGC